MSACEGFPAGVEAILEKATWSGLCQSGDVVGVVVQLWLKGPGCDWCKTSAAPNEIDVLASRSV
jgi:hypothetical protein